MVQEVLPVKDPLEEFDFPLEKYSDLSRLENVLKDKAKIIALVTMTIQYQLMVWSSLSRGSSSMVDEILP